MSCRGVIYGHKDVREFGCLRILGIGLGYSVGIFDDWELMERQLGFLCDAKEDA